jgi:hypothetical protein
MPTAPAGYAGSGSRSAVFSAFGLQFGMELGAALVESAHTRIVERAPEIPLVNHDR